MSIQKGLPPIYNADSEVLILGSFPSEKVENQEVIIPISPIVFVT